MKQYRFHHRILLLAVALVFTTQLVMLFPVLDLIKRDSDAQADRTVGLAGALFDEYIHNRSENQLTNVNLLASDYAFKQTVVSENDAATIRSLLRNHMGRVAANVAAVLDLDGAVRVSESVDDRTVSAFPSATFAAIEDGTRHNVLNIGGVCYSGNATDVR